MQASFTTIDILCLGNSKYSLFTVYEKWRLWLDVAHDANDDKIVEGYVEVVDVQRLIEGEIRRHEHSQKAERRRTSLNVSV